MAEFNTKCPHCNTELVAEEEWIGMEVECPSCKKNFTVAKEASPKPPKVPTLNMPSLTPLSKEEPLPDLMPIEETPATAEKSIPNLTLPTSPVATEPDLPKENSFVFVCASCGTQVELPAILKGRKYECKACAEESTAEPTTEKKCPYCGEMIKIHATVCKHCKQDVTNAPMNIPPAKEETFPYFCPECDAFVELPISMDGKEYECKACCETSIAKPATERKCPHCGEMIKIKATVCKHCKKSVQALPSNSLTLQPIQPLGNIQPNLQSLQPLTNGIELQPISLSSTDSQENAERINKINKIAYPILIAVVIIGWIIGLICCFVAPVVGILIFVLSPVIALLVLLVLPKEQFLFEPNEYLISTTRLTENKMESGYGYISQTVYFVRMTNKRLILSSVNYPFLPVFVAIIFDMIRQPVEISASWHVNDILRIDVTKEALETTTYFKIKLPNFGIKNSTLRINTKDGEYKFLDNGQVVIPWWNNVNTITER